MLTLGTVFITGVLATQHEMKLSALYVRLKMTCISARLEGGQSFQLIGPDAG